MVPLGKEPCQARINSTTDNRRNEADFGIDAQIRRGTYAADKARNREIVSPLVRLLPRIAALEAQVKGEGDDNGHTDNDEDECNNNEIRRTKLSTEEVVYHLTRPR